MLTIALLFTLLVCELLGTKSGAAGSVDPKALLHDASAAAAAMPDSEIFEKVGALQDIARAQAAIGDREGARVSVDIALRTLSQASTTGTYTLSAVVDLSEASAGGDPVELERTIRRAASMSRTLTLDRYAGYALVKLAEALARTGNPGAAIGRARSIADANYRQAALGTIAGIEAKTAGRPWVERAVAAASGPANRALILARVATIWGKAGDVAGARWAISEALRAVDRIGTTSWRNAALVEVAKAQLAVGDVEGARRAAGRIEASGDAWYIVDVLSVLAVGQAHAGDNASALASLQKSREAALRLPAEVRPKPGSPRAEALGKTAAAYAEIGDGDMGAAVVRAIPKAAPGREFLAAEALLTVAKIQAGAGDTRRALAHCQEAGKLLSNPADVVRYRWTCGDREGAWRAVQQTPGASTALWGLARAEARAGNLTDALKAAEAITDHRQRVVALAELVPAQARLGEVADARETAGKVTDESRRAHALQVVAWGRARSGDFQGAVDEALTYPKSLVRSRMLLGVVEAQLGWSTGVFTLSGTTERPWDLLPLKP